MQWTSDPAPGRFWTDNIRPFSEFCVGSLVPGGFEVILRLMHPITSGNTTMTWADLARRNNRTAHGDMQLHSIATPLGQRPDYRTHRADTHVWIGDLPIAQAKKVASTLRAHGAPATCYFAAWEGYGNLGAEGARIPTENRGHILATGSLDDLESFTTLAHRWVPNLWWPLDGAWCVVSEIDFAWTYIACSNELATAFEQEPALETYRVGYTSNHTVHGDTINR